MGATKLLTAAGGGITLDAASTATDKTITIPARTGNMAVDGPAFSAYRGTSQAISTSVSTKIQFNTEEFDTNSNYDKDTNYRFLPTVAGYYQFNSGALFSMNSIAGTYFITLFKNGTEFKRGTTMGGSNVQNILLTVSSVIYLNGTTDYVEVFAFQNSGSSLNITGFDTTSYTYFNGALVRAA